jgi:hypothetical protein
MNPLENTIRASRFTILMAMIFGKRREVKNDGAHMISYNYNDVTYITYFKSYRD